MRMKSISWCRFSLGREALKIANRMGKPVSAGFHVQAENVTAHFFNLIESKTANKLVYRNFYQHFYKDVDAIHYPTQFIRDTFERAIKHPTPGYVISNGVSSDSIRWKWSGPRR
jgi:1,2-diacylglycerol 3-alpha-glucosyltransferase